MHQKKKRFEIQDVTYNSERFSNCPFEMAGTVPVNVLPSRNRSRSKVALAMLLGIVPVNVLFDRYAIRIVGISKSDSGIFPLNPELETSKKSRLVYC